VAGLSGLTTGRKIAALGGFVMLGLTPSFMDWQQSPDKHVQFVSFYVIAGGLFWYGLLR
jgi:hypothetical protein